MALRYAEIQVELREVSLANKPQSMLDVSPKGTVPVLLLPNGRVLDESLDIMYWALDKNDPNHWRIDTDDSLAKRILNKNDGLFKDDLDHYKYSDRHPAQSSIYYRGQCEVFLIELEKQLNRHAYLFGKHLCLIDIAIFPFIRQFAFVDKDWFDQSPYPELQRWLSEMLGLDLFTRVMNKNKFWELNSDIQVL